MSKKILLLVHQDLVPPNKTDSEPDRFETPWITEYDVARTLKKLGHTVEILGIQKELEPLLEKIKEFKPNLVFNLLEEFNHDTKNEYKILALLDMLNIKYTGCNPKGLLLAKDKALCKKILKYHRIGTPNFFTLPKNKKRRVPKTLSFPLIVKCLFEEGSYGIAQASIVHSDDKLKERLQYIHETLNQDAIVEEFIPGKEIYVGIIGNKKLSPLPIWELKFKNVEDSSKEIYSQRAKWNEKYRTRKGIETGPANFEKNLEDKIIKTCKKVYQVLNLSGYARIDLRVSPEGKIYVLEANPNPNIASDDEFAKSAAHEKTSYDQLISSLL